ncbi:tyrosine-protein phosphatase non-receptor type 23 isoform X2 [Rhinoraja longicauda]
MEAVPRMPMIWLDLKEAGDFPFAAAVTQYILKHYGENPDTYSEELKKLDQLRQSAVNVTRDFEGCSTLRKYFGQLHYLQSRVPMGSGEEAAVPITWTEIFSGKAVTVDEICYEQACILYNLGALHSMLGAVDNRVTEEGMKVSCTHFQCSAGAFTYLRDHFSHSFSVDMSHQILNLNINLMLGQAQECLLEKSMLDNRKSFLVARISAQVVDYYKEACRALENSETASLIGKFQKDWKKLVQMKIYYYAAVAHLHMGKQSEEQQKYGERLAYFQSSFDKLNEAIKYAKGQPETVQEALRFTMDVIGGKYTSAKKDNDFVYHETVPPIDSLTSVKGASLVKALPVNPTDPNVTGPDIFTKLVPMEAHEASSLYSEEKAKLLREVVDKIDTKNEVLEQFMDSLRIDPDSIDNLDMYSHIPPALMEKCAALSVRPDTVKSLVQSMQILSGLYTDVEASLRELKEMMDQDESMEKKCLEATGKASTPSGVLVLSKEWSKYMEVHEKANHTNAELHKAMNLHISNLRLLSGPLEDLRAALPTPTVSDEDKATLQNMKRILLKIEEMRDQRSSLLQQLRDAIQKDDITTTLVTTDHSEMKKLFEEQLKKYDQLRVYIDQNLVAQENILKALTDANVKYAAVRKALAEAEQKWNDTTQTLVTSFEAYEDLMKKSQEGKEFYADLENKVTKLLDKMKDICQSQEEQRQVLLEQEMKKKPPPRPTAPKPLQKPDAELDAMPNMEDLDMQTFNAGLPFNDLPNELRSLPPGSLAAHLGVMAGDGRYSVDPRLRHPGPDVYFTARTTSPPLQPALPGQRFAAAGPGCGQVLAYYHGGMGPRAPACVGGGPAQPPYAGISHSGPPSVSGTTGLPSGGMGPSISCPVLPQHMSASSPPPPASFPAVSRIPEHLPAQPPFTSGHFPHRGGSPQHLPNSICAAPPPMGHPYSAGAPYGISAAVPVNTGLHTPAPPVEPMLAYPGQFSGQMPRAPTLPQTALGVRPSTTTVDSVHTPISSFTPEPHPAASRQPVYDPTARPGIVLPPASGVGTVCTYPYPPRFANVPPFAAPGPQHMYPPPAPLRPHHQRQIRPVMIGQQQPYHTPFYPQGGLPFQPQPRAQNPAHLPPQVPMAAHPQHGMQLRPHLYQHPAQEPVPAPGVPTHPGNAGFPLTPAGLQPQRHGIPQRHAMPTATEAQSMALLPASSAPGLPSLQQFTPVPPHLHPALQPVPLPVHMATPQPGPIPGHMAVPQPGQIPGHMAAPQPGQHPNHMAAPQPGPIPGHMVAPQPGQHPNHMAVPQPGPIPGHMAAPQPGSIPGHMAVPQPGPIPGHMAVPQPGPIPGHMAVPQPGSIPGHMAVPQPGQIPGHMAAPQPGQHPNHMAAPQPGPIPGHMAAPQPGPIPTHMAVPQPGPIPTHMAAPQPAPAPSVGGGPLQQPFSSGPSLPPTPAPSPKPVQGQTGPLPAMALMPPAMPGPADVQQRPPQSLTPAAAATQPVSDLPFQRQNSSTDDLLSSSPDGQHGGAQTTVTQPLLLPTKADGKEGNRPKGIQIIEQDPYEKPEHIKMLLNQLGSFKVIVESLDRPSFGSLTELDCKWKDLQDAQEKDARQLSIAIARCYTMKNRHQDIMPYDKNRIVIQSGKDDYINASMVEDLSSYCPRIIATQAPLLGTASDFWLMIYEQKVSLVVMLVSEQEIVKKVLRYFPTERGQQIAHGPITLTLTTQKITQTHVESMIGLQYKDQSLKRTVIHLQFTSWPELGLPDSKSHLLRFVQEVHGHYLHQRPLHTPVVVHCSSGVRRTGAFCLVYAAVQEVEAGNGIPELTRIVKSMRQQRKHMLLDKLHLKYCYEAILTHVEQVLLRHGVATSLTTKAPACSSQKSYSRQEPQDLVLGGDLPISSIQATIAKLSIRACSGSSVEGKAGPLPPLEPVPDPPPTPQQDLPTEASRALEEPQPPPPALPLATETTLDASHPTQAPDTTRPAHAADPQPCAAKHADTGAESSAAASLDLLASLTAEAFTLDANPRNRQKISKHNFLQHQSAQGLQAPTTGEDPLSLLDPLWTLNKS